MAAINVHELGRELFSSDIGSPRKEYKPPEDSGSETEFIAYFIEKELDRVDRGEKPYKTAHFLRDEDGNPLDAKIDFRYVQHGGVKQIVDYDITLDSKTEKDEGKRAHALAHEYLHRFYFPDDKESKVHTDTGKILEYIKDNSDNLHVRIQAKKGLEDWKKRQKIIDRHYSYEADMSEYGVRYKEGLEKSDNYLDEALGIVGDFGKLIEKNTTIPFLENYAGIRVGSLSEYLTKKAKAFHSIYRKRNSQRQAQQEQQAKEQNE